MTRTVWLVWTIHKDGREVDGGRVPDLNAHAEQVALDALADYGARAGLAQWDMAGLECVVRAESGLVELARADGRDW